MTIDRILPFSQSAYSLGVQPKASEEVCQRTTKPITVKEFEGDEAAAKPLMALRARAWKDADWAGKHIIDEETQQKALNEPDFYAVGFIRKAREEKVKTFVALSAQDTESLAGYIQISTKKPEVLQAFTDPLFQRQGVMTKLAQIAASSFDGKSFDWRTDGANIGVAKLIETTFDLLKKQAELRQPVAGSKGDGFESIIYTARSKPET